MMTLTIGPRQTPCGVLAQGREQRGPSEGILCIKQAWPATIRTIKGDHDRFQQTYFSAFQARAVSLPTIYRDRIDINRRGAFAHGKALLRPGQRMCRASWNCRPAMSAHEQTWNRAHNAGQL